MMLLVLVHGLMGWHGVVVWKLGDWRAVHQALHPKLDLWRGEKIPLLAKRLTRAHEGSGLVGRAALLIQANHPLVTLVGREVGSWGFSRKKS